MGRKVKCHITGAWGTSDTFVKIGNHYYKNQYVYDEDHRLKEERKQLIDYICKKFLHYADGQPFHTSLPKKLNELSFYDNAVILETFKTCESDILYWLEHKNFTNDYGKIAYMFAIVGNNIADVNRKHIQMEREKNRIINHADYIDYDNPNLSGNSKNSSGSLLGFLEGDEV